MSGARELARVVRNLNHEGQLLSSGVQGGIVFNSRVLTYATVPTSGNIGDIIYAGGYYRIWTGSAWSRISTS